MMGAGAVSNSLPPVSAATKGEQSFPGCTSEMLHYTPNASSLERSQCLLQLQYLWKELILEAWAGLNTGVTSHLQGYCP